MRAVGVNEQMTEVKQPGPRRILRLVTIWGLLFFPQFY